jgi:hypothetical protein
MKSARDTERLWHIKKLTISDADPGVLCRTGILDPQFFPQIKGQKDPGSGSASKNLSIFNPKNCFSALGNMIWDVHLGSNPLSSESLVGIFFMGSNVLTLYQLTQIFFCCTVQNIKLFTIL